MNRREPSTPPVIDGFTYVGLLGMGGFADVFAYVDSLGRKVAVKVLLRQDGVSEASFGPEGSLMARLSSHPSIVSVYRDGVAQDGRPYLVMEYCPPPHLSAKLRTKPLSVAQTLIYSVQVASAVHTAHGIGILHRDIKPANILFTEYGRPALTDFGISVTTEADGTGAGAGMSVAWAPPEQQVRDTRMGPPSDVYSLAATVYHMLAGHSPFHDMHGANDNYALSKRVRSLALPRINREQVPESLQLVLATAMAKQPQDRYQTALDLARALNSVQLELHHSPTEIEVPDVGGFALADDDEDAGGTKVDNFVLIDPDGPSSTFSSPHPSGNRPATRAGGAPGTALIQHGRGVATPLDPVEWTGFTDPDQPTSATPVLTPDPRTGGPAGPSNGRAPAPARSEEPGRRTVPWRPIAAALVVVAAIGGLVAYEATGGAATNEPRSTSTAVSNSSPADPIGAIVPTPAAGTAELQGRQVLFSWRNPSPQTGDEFLYRLDQPGPTGAADVCAGHERPGCCTGRADVHRRAPPSGQRPRVGPADHLLPPCGGRLVVQDAVTGDMTTAALSRPIRTSGADDAS